MWLPLSTFLMSTVVVTLVAPSSRCRLATVTYNTLSTLLALPISVRFLPLPKLMGATLVVCSVLLLLTPWLLVPWVLFLFTVIKV